MTSIMVLDRWAGQSPEADLTEYGSGFLTGHDGTRWITRPFQHPTRPPSGPFPTAMSAGDAMTNSRRCRVFSGTGWIKCG